MPPFRSLLSRKPPTQPDDPNAGFENALRNENVQPRPSQDSQPSGPLGFRRSREEAPNEYKLSGRLCRRSRHAPPLAAANRTMISQWSMTAVCICQ